MSDLQKYIGMLFYMTYYNLPNTRTIGHRRKVELCKLYIQSQMTLQRFEKIRELLHFNDKETMPNRNDSSRDRIYLVRPIH